MRLSIKFSRSHYIAYSLFLGKASASEQCHPLFYDADDMPSKERMAYHLLIEFRVIHCHFLTVLMIQFSAKSMCTLSGECLYGHVNIHRR